MAHVDVDIVVVGSGAAGLIAALTAREAGANVLVAEAGTQVGGSTRFSAGMMMAAGTTVQREAGIEDHPGDLFHDYMLVNHFDMRAGLARRLAYEGADGIAWLAEAGVKFLPYLQTSRDERRPRSHMPVGGGQGIVDALVVRCREVGVQIALGRRVDRLIIEGDSVKGVAVGDDQLRAKAVVLATGGFGANAELRERHLPTLSRNADQVFYIGPDSARGDGLALGAQANASTTGEDRCVSLLVPKMDSRTFDAFVPAWMLLLDPQGRRLCLETAPYGLLAGLVNNAGGRAYGIFDSRTLAANGSPELPTFKVEVRAGEPKPPRIWTTENMEWLIQTGAIVAANTVAELVAALELPAAASGSIERYSGFAINGDDRDHHKDPQFLRSIEHPPFYGVELRPAALGVTTYGLEIDESAAVLDSSARQIPGLYAAGECTGGVIGPRYVGSGNSLASCLVFGRVAGRSAAAAALI